MAVIPLPRTHPPQDAARALERTLARCWPDATPADLALAGLALRAVAQGHTCLDLDQPDALAGGDADGPSATALRAAATRAPFIGDADAGLPLVLDGGRRLYLRRYRDHEARLATMLRERAAHCDASEDPRRVASLLGQAADDALDWQRVALALSLYRRLLVLCGGPGTGKTWTIARMVGLWRERFGPAFRIGLAAPTGKAAARLAEALGPLAATIAPTTLHRLLGQRRLGVRTQHDAAHPLALDALIVDECSMVDLPMMARLVDAVPTAARLVLVGDPDQLPAVESGAVLAALAGFNREGRAPAAQAEWLRAATAGVVAPGVARGLDANVVHLSRKHRFAADSGLGALLDAIRAGDVARVRARLEAGAAGAVQWLQPSAASRTQVVSALREGYAPLLQARDPVVALEAMSRFRVLCALREGMSGTRGLNPWIEARLGAPGARIPIPWLVEANDALVGLYNGDLGVSLPADGSAIWFGAGPAARAVARTRLPAHASAWAMTVHKAQGSEFDAVMVLLPPRPHPLVSREWLYTALSRARQRVILYAAPEVVEAAVLALGSRHSGLADRLGEAGA
ncbi:MAG: exodeoxyribonuclease V subunit alpha [Xanthomonadales bacterium]|nr:exodeoxyribonuclease V subunit alpha [Xanthomonadales bacterium]